MKVIGLKDIKKIYGKKDYETVALQSIDLEISEGESIAIMGTSGSGKSTLLNILGCLDTQTSGSYFFNGNSINTFKEKELAKLRNSSFGFIVQSFALIDDFTVYENVVIPLDYSKNKKKKSEVINLLKKLGIDEKINKTPKELSGGQCQRVAIARALVNDPEVILADEPTGSLDGRTGQEIMNILLDLNKKGKTLIIVTHDLNIAKQCYRIVNIVDGKIIN
ncbi:ABC transporter ATP-binding protein [Clostridium botulinum]|uniref:Lipoprotein-releasing system ATP-binding protein LolD n=1 Tax=Clostridium botulinum (strain Eklund 17B / Type B) TaxID=935198 RepID=B2TR68_CLOBB|nr:lipoprotein-releasing system ATP-binding protein LolD [Clostridium botulinum B str. Eklund 17B (NRP)]MBY6977702.1 ABC transporter ATP-binding protein [Clostridium botulinum]MBY7002166.1 ABC transporter ATP-binding protein [Clostridium botulinum]MCR1275833.1 ABC transporter ATP-binding protein [Clostridium botulinum]NFD71360.1 ABC transporter ATP-binding protein [Clostridium botulinum]